jgi:pyruvate carboxylase
MGLGDKWPQIARMYADVNMALGDIVKVTPSSKVVGDLALFLVSHGMTIRQFLDLGSDHSLTLPNSIVEMISGDLGEPDGGWPKKVVEVVLKGGKPRKGRPGAHLAPVNLTEASAALEKKIGHKPASGDLMSYLMYPDVFLKFAKNRASWGELDVLPTPQFFYGMEKGSEIMLEIEPGKTLVIKFLAVSEPHPDGSRTVFFELNGQPREVNVRDKTLQVTTAAREKADPAHPGQVGAPIPGVISSIAVEPGQKVAKGDRVLVMDAMKMQTTVYAPLGGKVTRVAVKVAQSVEPKDLLLVIE